MTWHWFDDDIDDDFTPFERAQVLALQEVVRECVATQQRLMDILYWLATRLAPEEVDRRLTRHPFAFARMTPQAWRTFFEQALHDLYLTRGVASILQRLRAENQKLRDQVIALNARLTAQQTSATMSPQPPPSSPDDSPAPKDEPLLRQPPARYASMFSQEPVARRRELTFLTLMAVKGYSAEVSLRWELVQREEALTNPDSGSIKRLIARLQKRDLIQRLSVSMGRHRLNIVLLTELGSEVIAAMRLTPVESEWARLMRLHGGQAQQKHAAQVCLFTHLAWQRGWRTQVCPEVDPPADPDVLIEKEGERIYVEVEGGSGTPERRMKKWRNQRDLQGFAAICAPSEAVRRTLVREAQSNTKKGMATDFAWLREHPRAGLWAETW